MRAAITDRGDDGDHFRTIQPPAVKEGGADTAAPISMACRAPEPSVKALALAQIIGVRFIKLSLRKITLWRCSANRIGHEAELIEIGRNGGIRAKLPGLPKP